MMLIENTIFGVKDKVKIAIERLKTFEPPEGYYLAFSGGKDSQVVYELAKMAGVKFDTHMHLTSVDPPEVIEFVKKYYPEVELHRPEKTMFQLIIEHNMPPLRTVRFCCEKLKEPGGKGRFVITGIRAQESKRRAKRRMVEVCMRDNTKRYIHPIFDWSEEDVWEFIKSRGLPYCSLYDQGWRRIGCLLCPMATKKEKEMHMKRYPQFTRAYLRAFEIMLQKRKESGMDKKNDWTTPEKVMQWWIYGQEKIPEGQFSIFD